LDQSPDSVFFKILIQFGGDRRVRNWKEKIMNGSSVDAKPAYISHYGLRTKQRKAMMDWYQMVFGAKIQHENDFLAFMTFDEEHHRLVIWEDATTVDKPETAAGIDHVGYGFPTFGDLVAAYERLKARGIVPFMPLNHRFTTSLYYHDPDGNEVELSVDNFRTKEECNDFIRGDEMSEIGLPPFGYTFDADELARLYHNGASEAELARIGMPHIE
jgi:catechol 2,3-dioxygenase-like lactoylglutathione lyase family enzyme